MKVRSVLCVALCVFVAAVSVSVSGCGRDTNARKLDTPEGIDWEAIEAGGGEMNEGQSRGE